MKRLFLCFISSLVLSSPKAETYFMSLNKVKGEYSKTPESFSYWKENIAKESSSPKEYRIYQKEVRDQREVVGFELSLLPTEDNPQETLNMIFPQKPLPKISSFSTMGNGNILYMFPNKKCSKYLVVCSEQDREFIRELLKKFTRPELETLKHRKKIDFTKSPEEFLDERSSYTGPLVTIRRARELASMVSVSTDTADLLPDAFEEADSDKSITESGLLKDNSSNSLTHDSNDELNVEVMNIETSDAPSSSKSWSSSILGFLYSKSS